MPWGSGPTSFIHAEQELQLKRPRFIAYAPLYGDGGTEKRLAVASENWVHVYSVTHSNGDALDLQMEREFSLEFAQMVTGVAFADANSSSKLAVAFGPRSGAKATHRARIWALQSCASPSSEPALPLDGASGYAFSLEEHTAPINFVVANHAYFVTGDRSGECRVWHKGKQFARKGFAKLHEGGIVDLSLDRVFLYSAGVDSWSVRVWRLPDLSSVLAVPMEIPIEMLSAPQYDPWRSDCNSPRRSSPPHSPRSCYDPPRSPSSRSSSMHLAVTVLRRPQSRWAASRADRTTGVLYAAGLLQGNGPGSGCGALCEWSLGSNVRCQIAQVAHEAPIVALVYGPYDNGPLITANALGVFRIWNIVPRLRCVQEVTITSSSDALNIAIAIRPHWGFFSIAGDDRLTVWHRQGGDSVGESGG